MPEMHLRQHGFTYSASGDHLQTTNKEYKNSKKQENQDITRRTTSDKILRDKAILIKIRNMMDINVDLLQWFINFLIKRLMAHAHGQTPWPCI